MIDNDKLATIPVCAFSNFQLDNLKKKGRKKLCDVFFRRCAGLGDLFIFRQINRNEGRRRQQGDGLSRIFTRTSSLSSIPASQLVKLKHAEKLRRNYRSSRSNASEKW